MSQIKNLEKNLVVAVSKSGGTKETQLLAQTLKIAYIEKFGDTGWADNFLWLADPNSFSKLDALSWAKAKKTSIQADQNSDIGGRFSSPSTKVFLLPLFILLNRDFSCLEQIYKEFREARFKIREKALQAVLDLAKDAPAYFSPCVKEEIAEGFTPWLAQLFEESLGGKNQDKTVKTVVNSGDPEFIKLEFPFDFSEPVILTMAQMYYCQLFVAYLAGVWNINFVNQEYVEKYKKKMQLLEKEGLKVEGVPEGDLDALIKLLDSKIKAEQKFIEVVLYFFPDPKTISLFRQKLSDKFNQKIILIFIGSDWNHQSYQAAFGDKDTFFLLVCLSRYKFGEHISKERASENTETLRRIALATHQTLPGKSILYNLI